MIAISFVCWLPPKIPRVKREEDLSAGQLVRYGENVFDANGLPHKIIMNTGTNFISYIFEAFCQKLDMQQGISSYKHHSKGQAEACIKFVKKTIKMHRNQKRQKSTPPAVKTIPHKVRISLKVDRSPLFLDYDEDHYNILKVRQTKITKIDNDTLKEYMLILI